MLAKWAGRAFESASAAPFAPMAEESTSKVLLEALRTFLKYYLTDATEASRNLVPSFFTVTTLSDVVLIGEEVRQYHQLVATYGVYDTGRLRNKLIADRTDFFQT